MYKEVNFLLCGRVSGLVMTVSGLMDGVSDASGINLLKVMQSEDAYLSSFLLVFTSMHRG